MDENAYHMLRNVFSLSQDVPEQNFGERLVRGLAGALLALGVLANGAANPGRGKTPWVGRLRIGWRSGGRLRLDVADDLRVGRDNG